MSILKEIRPFVTADVTGGRLNALVKKIMRQTGQEDPEESIRRVLSGEYLVIKPKREWHERDGVIHLEVTSDGTSGLGWVTRFIRQGIDLHGDALKILQSPDFKPTRGMVYKIAIIKCKSTDRTFYDIRLKAHARQLGEPGIEAACLIREAFSDWEIKAMGISWIHVMHNPVRSTGVPTILSVHTGTPDEYENYIWVQREQTDVTPVDDTIGFAYIIPD